MGLIEDLLTQEEALRLKVYDDGTGKPIGPGSLLKGHPTIGVGRALDVNGITDEEAAYLLRNDIVKVQGEAIKSFPWFQSLSEVRQAVIISMIFNMGLGGLLEFKTMLAAISKGEYAVAAEDMLNSKWSHEVGLRAVQLATMMKTDQPPKLT